MSSDDVLDMSSFLNKSDDQPLYIHALFHVQVHTVNKSKHVFHMSMDHF